MNHFRTHQRGRLFALQLGNVLGARIQILEHSQKVEEFAPEFLHGLGVRIAIENSRVEHATGVAQDPIHGGHGNSPAVGAPDRDLAGMVTDGRRWGPCCRVRIGRGGQGHHGGKNQHHE